MIPIKNPIISRILFGGPEMVATGQFLCIYVHIHVNIWQWYVSKTYTNQFLHMRWRHNVLFAAMIVGNLVSPLSFCMVCLIRHLAWSVQEYELSWRPILDILNMIIPCKETAQKALEHLRGWHIRNWVILNILNLGWTWGGTDTTTFVKKNILPTGKVASIIQYWKDENVVPGKTFKIRVGNLYEASINKDPYGNILAPFAKGLSVATKLQGVTGMLLGFAKPAMLPGTR